jgi:hypothetical protein
MKWDICTKLDPYMRDLCHAQLMISWVVTLTDGTTVYGDYDRPGYEKCWFRLKRHCDENKIVPSKIQLYMFGAKEHVFFEDPNGLDGVSIFRGAAREQSMSGTHRDFQFLTVSLLRDDCEYIDVRKFVWPHNEFEEAQSTRIVTKQNIEHMIFKHDSEKLQQQKLQKYFNGATL